MYNQNLRCDAPKVVAGDGTGTCISRAEEVLVGVDTEERVFLVRTVVKRRLLLPLLPAALRDCMVAGADDFVGDALRPYALYDGRAYGEPVGWDQLSTRALGATLPAGGWFLTRCVESREGFLLLGADDADEEEMGAAVDEDGGWRGGRPMSLPVVSVD